MKMFRQTDTLLFFGRLMEDSAVRDHSMCVYRESLNYVAYLIQFKGSDDCFILKEVLKNCSHHIRDTFKR